MTEDVLTGGQTGGQTLLFISLNFRYFEPELIINSKYHLQVFKSTGVACQ